MRLSEACFTVTIGDRHDERAAMDFSMIIFALTLLLLLWILTVMPVWFYCSVLFFFVFHLLPFGHYVCLVLKFFNFSVFPPYAMWLNVISINLMQLSKRMLFTEWKNVWFTRYQLCTGDKVRHKGRPSTIQSVRVCQTRMATTCGGSSPTTLFQPPIWVIGRARLSSVGAPSNQLYRLDWLEELHTGHPGIVHIVHCY